MPEKNPADDFELLPLESPDTLVQDDALEQVLAAVQQRPDVDPIVEDEIQPEGMSWEWDWARNRFKRNGTRPAVTSDLGTLLQRINMRLAVARDAHPIFSPEFGLDRPYDLIGSVPDALLTAAWTTTLTEGLLADESIAQVFDFDYDRGDDGALYVSFQVKTYDDVVSVAGFALEEAL